MVGSNENRPVLRTEGKRQKNVIACLRSPHRTSNSVPNNVCSVFMVSLSRGYCVKRHVHSAYRAEGLYCPCAMSKSVAVFLAQGTEEMEFSITYDVLVRGEVKVTSVYVPADGQPSSPPDGYVVASRGVKIVPDTTLEAMMAQGGLAPYDGVVVPGGAGGAEIISKNAAVQKLLQEAMSQGKIVGMICAGSLAALEAQIGLGGAITSHPSVADKLRASYDYKEQAVATANNFVTSRGPGTTFPFALTLVEKLVGAEVRKKIAPPMMLAQEHL